MKKGNGEEDSQGNEKDQPSPPGTQAGSCQPDRQSTQQNYPQAQPGKAAAERL
jgi:hypothetical protein